MKPEVKILFVSYIVLLLVMFILPFYSTEGYSIVKNTTSQLGAQKTPNAWIMNVLFILMGLSSIITGWKHYQGFVFHQILLFVFGISLALTGIFHHAPIDPSLDFNVKEDELHSIFASVTGFSFTMLAIATGFIQRRKAEMVLPIAVGMVATLLSLLMFNIESLMGVWQRGIFVVCFGWMIWEFNKRSG